MWRRFLVLLLAFFFVAASSATKGVRKTKEVYRRTAQGADDLEKSEEPLQDPEEEKKGTEEDKKEEDKEEDKKEEDKKKKDKEKKEKGCKVKEPKLPKESKAPSTTPPPPPEPKEDPQVSVQANEDTAGEEMGGDPLVSNLPSGNTTTDDEDLPYCAEDENSEGLAGDLSTTRGAKIGTAPIAGSALGLVTLLLGFIGYKYYRGRRPVDNDGDKIAIANLY